MPSSQERTEQFGTTPANPQQPGPPPPPIPPGPTERLASPSQEPPPGKKRKRSIRDPLSLLLIGVIVISLVVAGLIGGE